MVDFTDHARLIRVAATHREPAPDHASPRWRREFWDVLSPWTNRVADTRSVAHLTRDILRSQVTLIHPPSDRHEPPAMWFDAWLARRMNPEQFALALVAGLRAIGLPDRLNADSRAECWIDGSWQRFDNADASPDSAPAQLPFPDR